MNWVALAVGVYLSMTALVILLVRRYRSHPGDPLARRTVPARPKPPVLRFPDEEVP